MRCKIRLACFAALQAVIAFTPSYGAATDEVIVHFHDRSQSARLSQIQTIQDLSAKTLRKIPNHGNIVLLEKAPGESMDDFLLRLRSNPDVLSAEQNHEIRIPDPEPDAILSAEEAATMVSVMAVPNDPLLTWGYGDIDADLAPAAPGDAPLVAVIDTGVDYTHPELAGRVIPGYDFHNDDDDPMDDHGHGTHVSGIIAAQANNGQGSAGVSPGSQILAFKVLGSDGIGSEWAVTQAIYAAADHPDVRVINLSLGSSFATAGLGFAVLHATQEQGKLVVAAAGNSNSKNPYYPARWSHTAPGVIGVAANDENHCKAWFSNYGVNATTAAPGVAIWSALPGNQYAAWSGTSMAAPFVAGAGARLVAENPGLNNLQLKSFLENNGDPLVFDGSCWPSGDYFEHLNLVDVLNATPGPTPDNEPPQVAIQSPTTTGNYETGQGSIEVAGTAADNMGISQVTWTNNRGGSGTAEGATSWTIPELVLQDGENIVTITAHDAAGNESDDELRVELVPDGTQVLTVRVDNKNDDGYEQRKKGKNVLGKKSVKIRLNELIGYHFDNVGIPHNATIISATLSQFGKKSSAAVTVEYRAEAAGDAATFTGKPYDMSQRAKTYEAVVDQPAAWPKKSGGYYPSSNLGAIVQELVSRSDWQAGQDINLFLEGTGGKKARTVMQFDSNPNQAAVLEIRFSE